MYQYKTITNHSKLGYGYSCTCHDTVNGWQLDSVDHPSHVGTINKIFKALDADNTFQSLKSGGTYMMYAWFVRHENRWYKIVTTSADWFMQLDYYGKAYIVMVEV